ncbi:unnamed protein product, partial [Arabidopsis lyrata]
MIDFS